MIKELIELLKGLVPKEKSGITKDQILKFLALESWDQIPEDHRNQLDRWMILFERIPEVELKERQVKFFKEQFNKVLKSLFVLLNPNRTKDLEEEAILKLSLFKENLLEFEKCFFERCLS